jgi:integrase
MPQNGALLARVEIYTDISSSTLLVLLSVTLVSRQNRISRWLDHQRPWGAETSGRSLIQVTPEGDHGQSQLEWRNITSSPGDRDLIFPNSQGGFMDYENFEARVLDPIRVKLELPKLSFQILRRTFATLAVGERKGTLKDVQKQLRHARPDTTLENYVKEIPDSVYRVVDAMYEGIAGSEEVLVAVSPLGGIQ